MWQTSSGCRSGVGYNGLGYPFRESPGRYDRQSNRSACLEPHIGFLYNTIKSDINVRNNQADAGWEISLSKIQLALFINVDVNRFPDLAGPEPFRC
jgi:hypothetical protein